MAKNISKSEIERVLKETGYNQTETAKRLCVHRQTLVYKIRTLKIEIPESKKKTRYDTTHYNNVYESLIKNKFNFHRVGEEFGVSYNVAYRWMELMKRRGYDLPVFSEDNRDQLTRAYVVRGFLARTRLN